MDLTLLFNLIGFGVAGGVVLVRWLVGRRGGVKAPAVGLPAMLRNVLALVDSLDDTDDVKSELGKDLFALLQEYFSPPPPPTVDVKTQIREEFAKIFGNLKFPPRPPAPPPPPPPPA